jgi:hypothetical protein
VSAERWGGSIILRQGIEREIHYLTQDFAAYPGTDSSRPAISFSSRINRTGTDPGSSRIKLGYGLDSASGTA